MSLIKKLFGKPDVEEKAKAFAKNQLDSIVNDPKYSHYFTDNADAKIDLYNELKTGYADHMKDYTKGNFLTKYVTPAMRGLGAVIDGIGTAMYWNPATAGGGLGLKIVGAAPVKTLADAIEARYLHNYLSDKEIPWLDKKKADARATAEAIAERGAALFPLGGGAIDYFRGKQRWYSAAEGAMGKKIKYDALEKILPKQKEGRVIPLSYFKAAQEGSYSPQKAYSQAA